ncbi:MAG: chlorophyll synthase ChlG [Pseudomonadales bacterium]|jgi:chlorophyll synthase|nr:chlorophyll synthase ChlG [Pseudomonadales bacterium]
MQRPSASAALELLKPVTWFPPMWAYGCGVVSAGVPTDGRWFYIVLGVFLAGPLVCGTSQVVNDWFDREVDAINEPQRPIPSGRAPGRSALHIAIGWTLLSLLVAALLGATVFVAALVGLALAWAYSAPPARLKLNGWYGNTAVGLCYEGLPWITGAAVMAAAVPSAEIFLVAFLYSAGAFGIMVLNDFKALEGDRQLGVRTIPVQLGPEPAARLACWTMLVPQGFVVLALASWSMTVYAAAVTAVIAAQVFCIPRLLSDPRANAPWYNATGVSLYVSGMMITAFALRGLP